MNAGSKSVNVCRRILDKRRRPSLLCSRKLGSVMLVVQMFFCGMELFAGSLSSPQWSDLYPNSSFMDVTVSVHNDSALLTQYKVDVVSGGGVRSTASEWIVGAGSENVSFYNVTIGEDVTLKLYVNSFGSWVYDDSITVDPRECLVSIQDASIGTHTFSRGDSLPDINVSYRNPGPADMQGYRVKWEVRLGGELLGSFYDTDYTLANQTQNVTINSSSFDPVPTNLPGGGIFFRLNVQMPIVA